MCRYGSFILFALILCVVLSCRVTAECTERDFIQALENGRLANEGFRRCRLFVAGWLAQADKKTGLIPRNLSRNRDIWNAQDSAADNYPFMVLTAAITDRELFEGRMLDMLHTETKLTSRIGAMPDTYSFSKQAFANENLNLDSIMFGSSEYIKDGLLPLTEWLGASPWSERMISILDDMWANAPVDTPYGKIVSTNVEVNGEMLQVLSRVYWMTGDKRYLEWAIRLGDYYLLGDHHPTGAGRRRPEKGQWILLDLGRRKKIAGADIAWIYGQRRKYRFKIEVSEGGKEFEEVFAGVSGGKSDGMERYDFVAVDAKLIRIVAYGNDENDWTNIAELAVRSKGGQRCEVKVVGASGHQSPNTPPNVADGDMQTRWSVGGVSTGAGRLRLRDHGCEIVSGLCELYAAVHYARPQKKRLYRKPVHDMLDRILEVGRNEHGLFYNWIDPVTGAHDKNPCDTWGYNLNGFYTVYLLDGDQAYRQATIKALGCLWDNYRNYPWEGSSSDGHADSIESALNLYNREPVASAAKWIDDDMQVMWRIQKDSGVIEGWHGDGNFARTTIMYCLWKTRGVTVEPWRQDVVFGAVMNGGKLLLAIKAEKEWEGKIVFDKPRHKTVMKMPLDWPRINQFPEWFTVDSGGNYAIGETVYSGKAMQEGIEIHLRAGKWKHLTVKKSVGKAK